jgi:hypothetical protein
MGLSVISCINECRAITKAAAFALAGAEERRKEMRSQPRDKHAAPARFAFVRVLRAQPIPLLDQVPNSRLMAPATTITPTESKAEIACSVCGIQVPISGGPPLYRLELQAHSTKVPPNRDAAVGDTIEG